MRRAEIRLEKAEASYIDAKKELREAREQHEAMQKEFLKECCGL